MSVSAVKNWLEPQGLSLLTINGVSQDSDAQGLSYTKYTKAIEPLSIGTTPKRGQFNICFPQRCGWPVDNRTVAEPSARQLPVTAPSAVLSGGCCGVARPEAAGEGSR